MYTYLVIPNDNNYFLLQDYDDYLHSNDFFKPPLTKKIIDMNILHKQNDEDEKEITSKNYKIQSLKMKCSQEIPSEYLSTKKFTFKFLNSI